MSRRGVHVAVYLLVLVALLAVTDRDDSWNLDDGAYATQVATWRETGGWAYPYRHVDRDPTYRFAPVSHATTTTEGTYPYVKFPAWIVVLRASTEVFGYPLGLHVPPLVFAVAAALAGGLLAEALARRRRLDGPAFVLGFWTVALGPIVVHTSALWAHTAAAALGGFAALLLVRAAEGTERRWHPWALAALAGGLCAIRTEGVLMAVALVVVAAIATWWPPEGVARSWRRTVTWTIPSLVATAAVRVANSAWGAHLAPGRDITISDSLLTDVGFVAARWRGAMRTLLDGLGTTPAATDLAVVVAVLVVAAGLTASRASARRTLVGAAALLGLALALIWQRSSAYPYDLGGLVVAAPVGVAGLAAWRWQGAPHGERALVGLIGLTVGGVLATQYPEGGSVDWGGRFLFVVLVPITVLGALALWRVYRSVPPYGATSDRVVVGALLAVTVVASLAGLRATSASRDAIRVSTDRTVSTEAATIIRIPRFSARTGWRLLPDADILAADPETAGDALAVLRPRGEPVAVIGPGADQVRGPGWSRQVISPRVVVFTPS